MRRTAVERLGRKPQEYADISRLSDDVFRQRGKQKIQELIGGAIVLHIHFKRLQINNKTVSNSAKNIKL